MAVALRRVGSVLKYNHMYVMAFSLESTDPDGKDVTATDFTQAVLKRVIDINQNNEWDEAVGSPNDTYEVQDEDA